MKSDLLNQLNQIKLFLFDLEGVLIKKGDTLNYELEKKLLLHLDDVSTYLHSEGKGFGIVTSHNNSKFLDKINSLKNCFVLSSSINKVMLVDELIAKDKLQYENIFYIGDDILDIPLLKKVGFSSTPKDSRREVKREVAYIAKSPSGEVLHEIVDYIKQAKQVRKHDN